MSQYVVGIDLGTTNTVVAAAPVDGAVVDVPVVQTVAPGETAALRTLPSFLYLPAEGELAASAGALPWSATLPAGGAFVGAFARSQGSKVPGRVIASAKSWLSVAGVDRSAPILPWAAADGVQKRSPVDVQRAVLAHVRAAWDHAHPDAPLSSQEVAVTIPASFDEVARELTVRAAEQAGLVQVRLLEEPQAAFYAFLARHERDLRERLRGVRLVLVVDVGGGTTDFTLVTVESSDPTKPPVLERIAVGEHLMLGGDNMDITLARHVEQKLTGAIGAIDAASWGALVESARLAKEALLSSTPPESAGVSLPSRGSKLVGGTKSFALTRQAAHELIVDGFFPRCAATDEPARRGRSALLELGLPYAQDAAITRHAAAFLRRHKDAAARAGARIAGALPVPDAVLLHGGVWKSAACRARFLEVLAGFFGHDVPLLDELAGADGDETLDVAVARGAAYAGLVRRGRGLRIGGGSARAYFIGVGAKEGPKGPKDRALCVVPKGLHEGERLAIDRTFRLVLDRPVGFALYSSTSSAAAAGELVDVTDELERLPALETVLPSEPELPVRVETVLTDVGTLDVSLHVTEEALRRFRLTFSTRTEASVPAGGEAARSGDIPRAEGLPKRVEEGREMIAAFFGNKSKNVDPSKVKDLRRDLERVFGPRDGWSTGLCRELAGALIAGAKNRRRTVEHERAFFQLVGFCLRPGTGAPFDDWRIEQLWPLFADGVQYLQEKPTWASWWVLWRRVAGGLSAERQQAVLAYLKPWVLEQGTGKKGQGPTPHGTDEMIRLLASLERIPAAEKVELGDFVLKKIGRGGVASWWPLGRLGARRPAQGSAHEVVPKDVAERWAEKVLLAELATAEGAAFALAQICQRTDDRALDVDEGLRARAAMRLDKADKPQLAQWVRERLDRSAADDALVFGEALPPGLRL